MKFTNVSLLCKNLLYISLNYFTSSIGIFSNLSIIITIITYEL